MAQSQTHSNEDSFALQIAIGDGELVGKGHDDGWCEMTGRLACFELLLSSLWTEKR